MSDGSARPGDAGSFDLIIRNGMVVAGQGVQRLDIGVRGERIVRRQMI